MDKRNSIVGPGEDAHLEKAARLLTFAVFVLDAVDVKSEHNLGFAVPRETSRLGEKRRGHVESRVCCMSTCLRGRCCWGLEKQKKSAAESHGAPRLSRHGPERQPNHDVSGTSEGRTVYMSLRARGKSGWVFIGVGVTQHGSLRFSSSCSGRERRHVCIKSECA